VYYRSSGQVRFRKSILEEVVYIFPKMDGSQAIIFSNLNGTTVISRYDPSDNSLQFLKSLPEAPLKQVLNITPDRFLLIFPDKIFEYNPASGLVTPVISQSYRSGVFDPLLSRLYLWEERTLDVYDSRTYVKSESREFEGPLTGFHITYNK
jgi:hypothetical protein